MTTPEKPVLVDHDSVNAPSPAATAVAQMRQARLINLLNIQEKKGVSQNEVARRTSCPPQYLNDVKAGRRALSERFARRLQDEFHVNYEWLLGRHGSMEVPRPEQSPGPANASRLWLPVFMHPIAGDPYLEPAWDGSSVELAGVATMRVLQAERPYALRFDATDRRHRICGGDLLLVSQAINESAHIQVIRSGNKCLLARCPAPGTWECLNSKNSVRGKPTVIGHVLGILWGAV